MATNYSDGKVPMDRRRGGSAPESTRKYHPTTGGYKADNIESLGQSGDKGASGSASAGTKSDDGAHDMSVSSFGNYPHSGANPGNFEGPGLGSTPDDPTRAEK